LSRQERRFASRRRLQIALLLIHHCSMLLPKAIAHSLAAAIAVVISHGSALAQDPFYAGKQVRMITHVGPASGYAVWARLVSNHLGRNIPGSPTIILQSMPGGGGLKAANYLYAMAPKNGLELGAVNRLVPTLSIMGATGASFDSSQFGWLGSPTSESNLCVVNKNTPVRTIEDLLKTEVIVGTDGVGSGLHIFPTALNAVLGTKFKVIDGYKDSGDVLIAIDRGELQGACQSAETLLNSRGDALRSGEWRAILQGGLARHPDFPDVPFVIDHAKTPEQKQVLEFLYASQSFGRPYLAPPGLPRERLMLLRAAFDATMRDPDFLADAAKQRLKVLPISGAAMDQMIADLKRVPKEIVATVAKLTGGGGN
jgi:tripartite-type tricarboxylate transporter receptor subunit TctC